MADLNKRQHAALARDLADKAKADGRTVTWDKPILETIFNALQADKLGRTRGVQRQVVEDAAPTRFSDAERTDAVSLFNKEEFE